MTWFIDAWLWRDGLAFASERGEGQLPGGTIVHLAPPWFDAVPVGNRSTPLWSLRGHFEEGPLDDEGRELGFKTLALATEFVRRAYLAGGRTEGTPEPSASDRPQPGGEGGGEEAELAWERVVAQLPKLGSPGDRKRLERSLELLCGTMTDLRDRFVTESVTYLDPNALEEETLLDGAQRISQEVRWRAWVTALVDANLVNSNYIHEATAQYGHLESIGREHLLDDLFRIPLPPRWRVANKLVTLEDSLRVVASDRLFLERGVSLQCFVPVVVAALLVAGSASPAAPNSLSLSTNDVLAATLVREAVVWLVAQLPGTELQGHYAEQFVTKLFERDEESPTPPPAQKKIRRTPPRNEPPASPTITSNLATSMEGALEPLSILHDRETGHERGGGMPA